MGKQTIVGDNTANPELFTYGYDALFSTLSDPEALADSILTLANNPQLRARSAKTPIAPL